MQFQDFSHDDGFFLRKIDRKALWEPECGSIDLVVSKVFELSLEDKYSLYWVDDEQSFNAVIGGLISARLHLQNIDIVTFTRPELTGAGIQIDEDSLGETACVFANKNHVDVIADIGQLRALCTVAKCTGRSAERLSKKKVLKPLQAVLAEVGCCSPDCEWCLELGHISS